MAAADVANANSNLNAAGMDTVGRFIPLNAWN